MASPMPAPLLVFVFLYLLSAAVTFVLALYVVFRGEDNRALQTFGILLVAIILWSVGNAARLLTTNLGGKIIWQFVGYIGVVVTPAAFLVFVLLYTGRSQNISLPTLALLGVEPTVTLTLLFTNDSHHLFYRSIDTVFVASSPVMLATPAAGFWVHTIYSYALVSVGVLLLVKFALTADRLYRIQTVSLLSGSLIPLLTNLVFLVGLSSNPALDLTPPTFALSALLIFVGIIYGRFAHFLPVTRESVLNTLTDGIMVVDSDSRVIYMNSAVKQILRESTHLSETDQLIGNPLSTVLPVLPAVETGGDVEADRTTGFEASIRRDGTSHWFWIRRIRLESKAVGSTVVTVTEISDRKARQRKARQLQQFTWDLMRTDQRDKIATLAVKAAEDVFSLPWSGVHLVDESGDRLSGVAATDSVDVEYGSVPDYTRDSAEPGSRFIWDVYDRQEPVVIADTQDVATFDTGDLPVRSVIIHPLGEHGVFISSSPKRKAFDETDVAFIEILSSTVTAAFDQAASKRELRENQRRLEQQNERLEEFTSVVSHDLRSPLNTATLYLELMEDDYDDSRLESVEAATERMEALISDLLTLARQGKIVDETTHVSLESIAREAWESIPAAGLSLSVETELGEVAADESRLRQAFENLFRNATDHADQGTEIRIGVLDNRSGFYVEDDGPGVPPDQREQVFEHGYSTSDDGTGLGLAIVKRIFEAHGWEIQVARGRDGGARFEVTGPGDGFASPPNAE